MLTDLKTPIPGKGIKARINELVKISAFPAVLNSIMAVIGNENSTIAELERIIEQDQAIAARVVSVSNSVYYGFSGKIGSIHQAILVLGFEMVKGIAVSTAAFKGLQGEALEKISKLWAHSYEVAIASCLIAEATGSAAREPAFLAGLLHDIGRPVLYQIFGKDYFDISAYGAGGLLTAEESAFGAAHPEAGAFFAERCRLPDDCVKAIRFHHNPERCAISAEGALKHLPHIVYLADLICLSAGGCVGEEISLSPAHEEILVSVNMDNGKLDGVRSKMDGMRADIEKLYSCAGAL